MEKPERNRPISYKEGAEVREPVDASELPARPAERQPNVLGEGEQRTGPGVKPRRSE